MRVALVTSWLNQYGGAERVLEVLHEMYPQAPVFTSIFRPEALPPPFRQWEVRLSFLDKLPFIREHHQPFLPLYPLAFESFDLKGYDLVLSISSAFAHGVITPPQTSHISYCLTPPRFLWDYHHYAEGESLSPLARALLAPILLYLRLWDLAASRRVDRFLAISRTVQRRIAKYWGREAEVIYPPIDVSSFTLSDGYDDYFLVVSRLVPYKRLDLAVQAFSELKLPLMVVGDGRDRARLQVLAGPNIRFMGRLPEGEMRKLLSRCQALIFPGEEDFGLVPLEAQASGRPVIAYAAGGALETVEEGVSGLLFHEQGAEALAEAVRRFDASQFSPALIRERVRAFDIQNFRARIKAYIEAALSEREA